MKFPPSYAGLASNSSRPEYLATGMSDYNVRENRNKDDRKGQRYTWPSSVPNPMGSADCVGMKSCKYGS